MEISFFGGGFGGAEYNKKTKSVYVYQDVNPAILAEINNYYGSDKGENMLHEASEGYEAGKLAQEVRGDIIRNTIGYNISHNRAKPQFGDIIRIDYDKMGIPTTNLNETVKAEWYVVSPDKERKMIHSIED